MKLPHDVTIVCVTETNGVQERNVTLLHGVLIDSHAGGVLYKSGLQSDDAATLYVPESVEATDPISGQAKAFCSPEKYIQQPDKSGIWTLITNGKQSGCDCYIVKGRIDLREKTDYQTLRKSGLEVYRVSSCDFRDYGSRRLHHWQVGLK